MPTPPATSINPTPASLLTRITAPAARLSMATMSVTGASKAQIQVWQTATRRRHQTRVGQGKAQERTEAAEFLGPVRNPTEIDSRIIFSGSATTPVLVRREAGDMVFTVNIVLASRKLPTHARLQRLPYNDRGNLRGLMETAVTTKTILPMLKETVMRVARNINLAIIDVTGDQK